MAGRLVSGALQLGKQLKNLHLGNRIRTLTTGPVPSAGDIINRGFDFGHPPFGDRRYGPLPVTVPIGADGLPKFVNWTLYPGAVWEAQDQEETGLCYAFAALGSAGSLNFIKTGNSVQLAVQQVVDCNRMTGDVIFGGEPHEVLEYMVKGGGILPSSIYPFTGQQGVCQKLKGRGVTIEGWRFIKPNSEAALKYAVAHQPVVVSICCERRMFVKGNLIDFHKYEGGIITGPSYSNLDHSVLLFGYDETVLGQPFWWGLNSHSVFWGEGGGQFRLARSTGQRGGALGVLREPLVPLMARNKTVISKCDACGKCF